MPTILVVDDSEIDRRLVGGLLEKRENWNVIYAADGQIALTQIELQEPDLVITDLVMPNLNGRELVEAVRHHFPQIPVILMTAKGSEQIAVKALQYGAASYVPKKNLAKKLVRTVDKVLAAAREGRTQTRLMHLMTECESTFVIENDPDIVLALVNHLKQTTHCVRLEDDIERVRLGIALEEALLNALYHGNLEIGAQLHNLDYEEFEELFRKRSLQPPYCNRRIHVRIELSQEQAKYIIRDEGPGFDPTALPDPTEASNLEKPGGRGVLLMRTFMDDVIYNAKGNEVTLVKQILAPAMTV